MSPAGFPAVTSEFGFVILHVISGHLVYEQGLDSFVGNDHRLKY